MNWILSIILFALFVSCDSDDKINRLDLLKMAKEYDPEVSLILADEIGSGPSCVENQFGPGYGAGCVTVFTIKVGILELQCVEFLTVEQAKAEAKKIKQWGKKNWVFDFVHGEPPLEEFLKKAIGAKSYLEL